MMNRFDMGWTAEVQRLGWFVASSSEEVGSECEGQSVGYYRLCFSGRNVSD